MLNLSENLNRLGEEIIGNLDDAGYLKRGLGEILNELELFENIKVDPEEAENLLKRIQLFDPLGIASRNLQECLLVQIKNIKNADQYYRYIAENVS